MTADTRGRRRSVLVNALALVVVGLIATVLFAQSGTGEPPVDKKLAAKIRAVGITPYVVDFAGADLVDVSVGDHSVSLDYGRRYTGKAAAENDLDYDIVYTVSLTKARRGDLCAGGSGPTPDGGWCTSQGDISSSGFEEMETVTQRKGDTLVTMDAIDDDLRPAFAALDRAKRVSADELARHGNR